MIIRFLTIAFLSVVIAQEFISIDRDSTTIAPPIAHGRIRTRAHRKHHRPHRRPRISSAEEAELRRLEAYDEQQEEYKKAQQAEKDKYYRDYFDRMRGYAVQTHIQRYNQMLEQQRKERERFEKVMNEFGVREEDVLGKIQELGGPPSMTQQQQPTPRSPFGNVGDAADVMGNRARAAPMLEPQRPSNVEPRPENREVHRKALSLEALCSRFLPTVRKHCFSGNKTEADYVKRCNAYFHDCHGFLPEADPLYSIANSFNSGVGLNLGTVGVKGIPYYPINEEGAVEVGREASIPFGSWGGGYSENLGVRDYWSQKMEVGANWYEGKYGYKSGWSVPLVQSLGIEGDTHALVSVPLKPGELGKPIGVDVGGGVGPYYQQNQHVGVDYMNGQVDTNFGVGVPMAGVGVNTGVGVHFPSINDIMG